MKRITDAVLRAHGWVIFARPRRGEPIWRLRYADGTWSAPRTQSEIVKTVREFAKKEKPAV